MKMTVAELIERLKMMPQEAQVEIRRCGEPMTEDEDYGPSEPEVDTDGVVQI